MTMNVAKRRYLFRFLSMMTLYAVSVVWVTWTFATTPPEGDMKYWIAAVPALPTIGSFYVFGRYLFEETDEFVRHANMVALLMAMGLVLSFCAVWGFLEFFNLVPHIGLFHITWGFWVAFAFGHVLAGLFYR
jgi:hypothetical protein